MQFANQSNEITPSSFVGQFLTAEEVGTIAALMQELRDVTQSRRTFVATTDFLARVAAESERPRLVPHDALEY